MSCFSSGTGVRLGHCIICCHALVSPPVWRPPHSWNWIGLYYQHLCIGIFRPNLDGGFVLDLARPIYIKYIRPRPRIWARLTPTHLGLDLNLTETTSCSCKPPVWRPPHSWNWIGLYYQHLCIGIFRPNLDGGFVLDLARPTSNTLDPDLESELGLHLLI